MPPNEEKPTARWQKHAAIVVVLIVVLCLILFNSRIEADFWPLDNSRIGPNLLASLVVWAVIFILGVLLYPPIRRAVHRFIDKKADDFKAHVSQEHARLHRRLDAHDDHHQKHALEFQKLHERLDQIGGAIGVPPPLSPPQEDPQAGKPDL